MKNKDSGQIKLNTSVSNLSLIDKLERRLSIFKERLIREFMRGNIPIDDIIDRGYLKLFDSEELDGFFKEINHIGLNYGELNDLIKLGDKKAYNTLKKRFNRVVREKTFVLINEWINSRKSFLEYFQNYPELKKLLKKINKSQIESIKIKELIDSISLSNLTDLVQELYKPDILYNIISIKAIKNLESQYD